MQFQSIAVIGAGTMGRGIIETALAQGLDVIAIEADSRQKASATDRLRASLERHIRRGLIDVPDADAALARLTWRDALSDAAGAEAVIEAVTENEPIKRSVFEELDRVCPQTAFLASNTSSISITLLGAATARPERVIGLHFFNPVPIMPPVEIVRGLETSDETVASATELAERLGKQPFEVNDSPGFAVNRILMPLINEAVFALQEGVAERETIDALMKSGCNHPMGPLELADFVGLDVCLSILEVLHEELGDQKFRPCPLLKRMVAAGHLGRKSGEGFYRYGDRK
jgi:3-hydroxybutyryl-CoA dehydrogenase